MYKYKTFGIISIFFLKKIYNINQLVITYYHQYIYRNINIILDLVKS